MIGAARRETPLLSAMALDGIGVGARPLALALERDGVLWREHATQACGFEPGRQSRSSETAVQGRTFLRVAETKTLVAKPTIREVQPGFAGVCRFGSVSIDRGSLCGPSWGSIGRHRANNPI